MLILSQAMLLNDLENLIRASMAPVFFHQYLSVMPIKQSSWPRYALPFIFGISTNLNNFLLSWNEWYAQHEKLGLHA